MSSTWLATSHRRKLRNRATTSGGDYSIITEDGRVRPKHVLSSECVTLTDKRTNIQF
jgi:hypothetical protein